MEVTRMAVLEAALASWEEVVWVVPCMDAVVKVFCVHTEPNFSLPWQRKRQYSSSCSGFIIGGRRVLTNAHSVEHYTHYTPKLSLRSEGPTPTTLPPSWPSALSVALVCMASSVMTMHVMFVHCN
jgi:hypothetical protein